MLSQLEEGKLFLESPSSHIRLDLSQVKPVQGIYVEGCFVIVEGTVMTDVLHASVIGFPPPESRETTLNRFRDVNFGWPELTAREVSVARALEQSVSDAMLVILSDVHMDSAIVRDKLRIMFEKYAATGALVLFILFGPFSSQPYVKHQARETSGAPLHVTRCALLRTRPASRHSSRRLLQLASMNWRR